MRKNNTAKKTHARHTEKRRTHRIKERGVVERVNEVITRSKQREGVKLTKEQITDKKYQKYCDEYNAQNTVKTHNTHGGWRQPRRYASGLSMWQRWAENELAEKNTAIDEVLHRHGLAHHTAAVILYDKANGRAGAYAGRAHTRGDDTHITIIGVPELKIPAHRTQTDEWNEEDMVEVEGERITMEELVRTAMAYKAEIYTLE